jgi:arsenite methyltransferase
MKDYHRCIEYWDPIFSEEDDSLPSDPKTGNAKLDDAIRWLCEDSKRVLDFGCGNGSLLFHCALNGTKEHLGIDLSKEAVLCAKRKCARMPVGEFEFLEGGVEALFTIANSSTDAVILSNIVDNLYPEDALQLLHECARLLKQGGKVLIKLNPYLTQEQIAEWNIKSITGNLLDDGLLLWNNTTEQWREIFQQHFSIVREGEIYYPEYNQTNRFLCLAKLQQTHTKRRRSLADFFVD